MRGSRMTRRVLSNEGPSFIPRGIEASRWPLSVRRGCYKGACVPIVVSLCYTSSSSTTGIVDDSLNRLALFTNPRSCSRYLILSLQYKQTYLLVPFTSCSILDFIYSGTALAYILSFAPTNIQYSCSGSTDITISTYHTKLDKSKIFQHEDLLHHLLPGHHGYQRLRTHGDVGPPASPKQV